MAKVEIEDTELAQLRRQLAKLEAEVEQRKDYDTLKTRATAAEQRLSEMNAGREKAAFESAGVTSPAAQKFLRMEFEGLSGEGKPTDVVAWLDGFKADPTKIPADLAPFIQIPTAGTQAGAAGGQVQRPTVTVPNTNVGTQPPAGPVVKWTGEAIKDLSLADYSARRAEILASSPELRAMTQGLPGTTPSPAAPPAR